MIIRKNLLIEGKVQGVFYRVFTRERAKELNLTGWVRNLPNSKVEAEIQGSEENIKKMINYLRKGPSQSRVDNIIESEKEPEKEFDFKII